MNSWIVLGAHSIILLLLFCLHRLLQWRSTCKAVGSRVYSNCRECYMTLKVLWNSLSFRILKMYQLYMEDMRQIKKVAVLPNSLGPGSWEISKWYTGGSSCHCNVSIMAVVSASITALSSLYNLPGDLCLYHASIYAITLENLKPQWRFPFFLENDPSF